MNILDELKQIEDLAREPSYGWEDQPAQYFEGQDVVYFNKDEDRPDTVKSPSGTTYAITVENTAGVAETGVQLFGFTGEAYVGTKPGTLTIVAQAGYGSYNSFLDFQKQNPFMITAVRFSSSQAQIDQMTYQWFRTTPWGKSDSNIVALSTYRTEKDFQAGILTMPISHVVDSATYIQFDVLATTVLNIVFFVGLRKEASRIIAKQVSQPTFPGKVGTVPAYQIRRALSREGG